MLLHTFTTIFLLHLTLLNCAKECEFSMRLIPGFNPLRQIDENGKECRGNVEIPFCRGYCKTSESGTHGFPPRIQNSSACSLIKTSVRKVILEDCDKGASEEIKFIMVDHGAECHCATLPLDHPQN